MNILLILALLLGTICSGEDSLSHDRDTLSTGSVSVTHRESGPRLSQEEFVRHYTALHQLLQESRGKWELFEEKRDTYMMTHSLTEEDLTSFVNGTEREPEFWVELWEQILRELDIESADSLSADP